MTVVYVDVLFLINFCMDFLALLLSGAFLHAEADMKRLAVASALGGVYAVLAALYPGAPLVGMLIGGASALLLCYVAYGHACKKRRLWCLFVIFYGASWLLGGMITGAYELLKRFFEKRNELFYSITEGNGKITFFFLVSFSCAFLLALAKRHLYFKKEERSVDVTVTENGKSRRISALVDSGNLLCDPLSGRPCIVISHSAASGLLPMEVIALSKSAVPAVNGLSAAVARRIRLIPADTVGGHRLLIGYRADGIAVEDVHGIRPINALLAIGAEEEYGGHAALIPSILA